MTCAQGLLRLLWGGPEVGVLRDCVYDLPSTVSRRYAYADDLALLYFSDDWKDLEGVLKPRHDYNLNISPDLEATAQPH